MSVTKDKLFNIVVNNRPSELKKIIDDNILNPINLNLRYNEGTTLLFWAAYLGYIDVINVLLSYPLSCPVNINDADDYNTTALYQACDIGNLNVVKTLLLKRSEDILINKRTILGNTPLHISAYKGHKEIIKTLLNYGASYNLKNNSYKTARELAIINHHIDSAVLIPDLTYYPKNNKFPTTLTSSLNTKKISFIPIIPSPYTPKPTFTPAPPSYTPTTTTIPITYYSSTASREHHIPITKSVAPPVPSLKVQNNAAFIIQKAYVKYKMKKELEKSSLKYNDAYIKLESGSLFNGIQMKTLSKDVLEGLKKSAYMIDGDLKPDEKEIFHYITKKANFYLTHGTNSREIAQKSKFLKSNVTLSKVIPGFKANTFEIDKKHFSNDDFIFFTLDLKAKHTKSYGKDYFYINANDIEFFQNGWISYIDFLDPNPFKSHIYDNEIIKNKPTYYAVREPKLLYSYNPNPDIGWKSEIKYGRSYYFQYHLYYPFTKKNRIMRILDIISYAGDIKESIAYNIIYELRLMGLSNKVFFASFSDEDKLEFCSNFINKLFYIEAKMPKEICLKFMRKDLTYAQFSLEKWKKDSF